MKNLILILLITSPSLMALEIDQAKKILKPFKMELMKTLKGELKKNGGPSAVKVCHAEAMPITNKHGKTVLGLGRTSHKLRNSKNAPKDWVKPYLKKFKAGELKKPMVIRLKDGVQGYLEPIKVNGACLKCHGQNIQPEIQGALDSLYPNDKAVGFKAGEFRGLFWLEVKEDI